MNANSMPAVERVAHRLIDVVVGPGESITRTLR
jgi:hypothetical protein